MIDEEVVCALVEPKTLATSAPSWQAMGGHQQARIALQLQGVGFQGLFVRVKVPDTVDGYGAMVQIEWDRRIGKTVPLERVEWKKGHTNTNRGPDHLRLLHMDSTHIHRFEHNYLQDDGRLLTGNLPIAEPINPDPEHLQEFFQCCDAWLKLEGLALLERPPFQSTLPW